MTEKQSIASPAAHFAQGMNLLRQGAMAAIRSQQPLIYCWE